MSDKIRCSHCGSTQIYIRRKTKERICKICGLAKKLTSKELNEAKDDLFVEN